MLFAQPIVADLYSHEVFYRASGFAFFLQNQQNENIQIKGCSLLQFIRGVLYPGAYLLSTDGEISGRLNSLRKRLPGWGVLKRRVPYSCIHRIFRSIYAIPKGWCYTAGSKTLGSLLEGLFTLLLTG